MDDPDDASVDAIRRFNRFLTGRVGALDAAVLDSGLSLAQVRVLHELATRDAPVAAALAADLSIDPGYLSRMLQGLRRRGWVAAGGGATGDARRRPLRITAAGRRAYLPLERAAREQVRDWLAPLDRPQRDALVGAMARIERLLGAPGSGPAAPVVIRPHRVGDLGWIVFRHGVLYAREYGWDQRFEALVAGIVQHFVDHFDATGEGCWIAERDGEPLGSVMVVRQSRTVAKLRLLLVEPQARGLGLGRTLVREAMRFARDAGYRRMVLWTNDPLVAARGIYQSEGFVRVKAEPHDSFGHRMVGEYWERRL